MAMLTDQIDHFVRWFFNSSPEQTAIEPRPPSSKAKPPIRPRPSVPAHRRHSTDKHSSSKREQGAGA